MTRILSLVAVLIATSFAQSAVAATLTFDFTKLGSNHASLTVASNEDANVSVDVTVKYYTIANNMFVAGSSIDVDTNSYGLISKNWKSENHTIDSYGYGNEAMIFTFAPAVRITNVLISWAYGTGAYDVFVDNVFAGNTQLNGVQVPTAIGNVFAIGARGIEVCEKKKNKTKCRTKDTGIKISSISVEMTPVPVPASALLLVGALGGLGLMRRRKMAARAA